jgi:hypothetical protein
VSVLTELGVTVDTTRAALDRLVGTGGFCERDAAALRTLGIDVDEVRRRVEARFGPGALDRPQRPQCRRRLPWRRDRCVQTAASDHLPFMPSAKRALDRALRESLALRDRHVGAEHLLLGLLDPRGNKAIELLRHLDADPDVVRTRLLADLGKAA